MITFYKIGKFRLDRAFEMMCDDFCHWPIVSADQDVLEKHCEECPLNHIHNDEFWEKYDLGDGYHFVEER